MRSAIHVTHEAAQKIGGIGAVLSGLCTSQVYHNRYHKTYFYGPLFDDSLQSVNRLGTDAKILFSNIDGIYESLYNQSLLNVVDKFNIDIVYGQKEIYDEIHPENRSNVEIILIGIKSIRKDLLDIFKFSLWEKYNFNCQLYENDWDFEQYLRIALPLRSIFSIFLNCDDMVDYYSHEYMGICSCLSILKNKQKNERLYFYAHEVSTARNIVEKIPGHDVSFYNIMNQDLSDKVSMEERFGSYKHNSRNELIKFACLFDDILAVGDFVKDEYQYLNPKVNTKIINVCYNGIPINKISFDKKLSSRKKIQEYCNTLFNYTPEVILTHVSRLVISKGLWRDVSLLESLDLLFTENHIKGFFIILSSLIGTGRDITDIHKMETDYGWPVWHKENWPDLVSYENDIFWSLHYFNAKSRSIKGVFLNQYGFDSGHLGKRFPKDTNFSDLRIASDAEFGMSIYEPFGIAQIETVPYGGVAVLSRACGSSFLLEQGFNKEVSSAYHVIDFSNISHTIKNFQDINIQQRTHIEKKMIAKEAKKIYQKIPKTEKEREYLFNQCMTHSEFLSWDSIAKRIYKEQE